MEVLRGEREGVRWERAGRAPCAALRPFVRGLAGYDERASTPQRHREFPVPWIVLILEFGPPLRVTLGGDDRTTRRHPGGFAVGLGERFAHVAYDTRQSGVQVDLTPTGARRLFGRPLAEISGRVVALRDLLPGQRELMERLAELSGWDARLDLVESFLARRILSARVDSGRVDWAVARIERSAGALQVGGLARELGHSRKHLAALFRDQVGISPKLLARIVRFDRALARASAPCRARWADLAASLGYCDQAHLAREVRHFTGLTPTESLAIRAELAELLR